MNRTKRDLQFAAQQAQVRLARGAALTCFYTGIPTDFQAILTAVRPLAIRPESISPERFAAMVLNIMLAGQ